MLITFKDWRELCALDKFPYPKLIVDMSFFSNLYCTNQQYLWIMDCCNNLLVNYTDMRESSKIKSKTKIESNKHKDTIRVALIHMLPVTD